MNTVSEQEVAIVIVTYKRQVLLRELLESVCALNVRPQMVVVVDNENSLETKEIVQKFKVDVNADTKTEVVYAPQSENTGGSGGFSAGVEIAYKSGIDWIWTMDDDVAVMPNALDVMQSRLKCALKNDHRVLQPSRQNFDGTPFYWQYNFLVNLGIPNPIAPSTFAEGETYIQMNTACFEGSFFHRSIVQEIGYPDPRFFIYWDDTVYGYLASKITDPILINDIIMRRTRKIDNIRIGTTRKLNSTSDMVRFYIMRNRGYMANYFKLQEDYHFISFTFGTFLTLAKEVIRLKLSGNFKSGIKALFSGMKEARRIRHDKTWKPMPPILE
ncbi:MAG: glycosyltransferase [Candidatus Ancillula sp.]|jgi:glycosyltransferase involved in cell wall biosynthesis|nr:glycosyltransferase [Candidatus Ancillula sp.]